MSDITEIIDRLEKSAQDDRATFPAHSLRSVIAAYREQAAELAELRDQTKRAERQRDELLAALKSFMDQAHAVPYHTRSTTMHKAHEVIAKAEADK